MMSRKRIEITLTTREILVVRGSPRRVALWCSECAGLSQMLTPDEAAALIETSARAIYRFIESGELHFTETDYGLVLVCFNSLPCAVCTESGIPSQEV